MGAVKSAVPEVDTLRDKDRGLWGRSFFKQLQSDLKTNLQRTKDSSKRKMRFTIDIEREQDGRWLADIPAYGAR